MKDENNIAFVTEADVGGGNGHAAPMGPEGFRHDYAREPGEGRRPLDAAWLAQHLLGGGSVVNGPVEINHAVIEGELDLSNATFNCPFSITDSEFRGEVKFAFSKFERGLNLRGSKFGAGADFRAAHSAGDFGLSLAEFEGPASFEDIHVGEVFCAEGARFGKGADFTRAHFAKSTHFCCALFEGGRARRTEFRGEARFDDARTCGPAYFNGAHFDGRAAFDRARFESSAFFNCDALTTAADSSQPRHERYAAPAGAPDAALDADVTTVFAGDACFVGVRVASSVTFAGAQFEGEADFRRVGIEGTALFNPFVPADGRTPTPVRFRRKADFWNADIKGAARFEAARFEGRVRFQHACIGRDAVFSAYEVRCTDQIISTFFGEAANFRGVQVKGSVKFDGAVFDADADFDRLRAEGGVLFRAYSHTKNSELPPERAHESILVSACFRGRARFAGAKIGSNLEFDGVEFAGEANFERVEVGGDVYFRPFEVGAPPARFGSRAIFIGACVEGNVEFSGARFAGNADFTGLQVRGSAYFDTQHHYDEHDGRHYSDAARRIGPVVFGGRTQFSGAHLQSEADFRGTVFRKAADFNGLVVEGKLTFEQSRFGGGLLCGGARFQSEADFGGTVFRGATDFSGLVVEGKLTFERASFDGDVLFGASLFKNAALFGGAAFDGRADFTSVNVAGSTLFPGVSFAGPAQFSGVLFRGEADFAGAAFGREANFNGAVIEGLADFGRAGFAGDAVFSAAQFHNSAHFPQAAFGRKADFTSINVAGTTLFPGVSFAGPALFCSTVFKSELDFGGARFRQAADFTGTLVEGTASFVNASFGGKVIFRDGNFIALAFCEDPPRHHRGQFLLGHADLRGLTYQRIEVDIYDLLDGLDYTQLPPKPPKPRPRMFGDSFSRRLDSSLADRLINAVLHLFSTGAAPRAASEGGAYDLLYDRQPYTQLVNVLRAMGHDTRAEKVYLIQRGRERRRRWNRIRKNFGRDSETGEYRVANFGHGLKKIPFYLLELLHWRLSNYGVRPIRLVLLSALVIALGAFMFSRHGAVELKDAEEAAQNLREIKMQFGLAAPELAADAPAADAAASRTRARRCFFVGGEAGGKQVCDLEWPEAIGVSLCQFIPIIEIPSGSKWKPTDVPVAHAPSEHATYALYGTIHKGAGAVLVPLLVAALTGILYRGEKLSR